MFAQALIIATAALASFGTQCDPVVILDSATNPAFDITSPSGAIGTGAKNVFAGFGRLTVTFQLNDHVVTMPYEPGNCYEVVPCFSRDNAHVGYLVIFAPQVFPNGLQVSRKVFVPRAPNYPNEPMKDYIRYFDRFDNLTPGSMWVEAKFEGQFTLNDAALDPPVSRRGPGWAFIGDPSIAGKPFVGIIFDYNGERTSKPTAFEYVGGKLSVTRHLVLKPHFASQPSPGSSLGLLNFVVQTWTPMPQVTPTGRPLAPSEIITQSVPDLLKKPDTSFMTPEEKSITWNFIDTDVNMDSYVNVLDLILVRNDIGHNGGNAQTPRADVNHDYKINILDLILVRNDLGWPF